MGRFDEALAVALVLWVTDSCWTKSRWVGPMRVIERLTVGLSGAGRSWFREWCAVVVVRLGGDSDYV